VRLDLDIMIHREGFHLRCQTTFGPGTHVISGPVGSGKTSLALAVSSLLSYEGSIEMEGAESVLMSFQFPEHHITAASVEGEVRSWGLDPDVVLPQAGLEDRRGSDPLHLSRGNLKRLNLACLLARDPDVLVLDEPFSSLDCVAKNRLCRAIESRSQSITLVFSHERCVLPRASTLSDIGSGALQHHGQVPDSITLWKGAPPYLREALQRGGMPENITLEDAREALCRMRD